MHGEDEAKLLARILLNAYPSMTLSHEQLTERLLDTQAKDDISKYHLMYDGDNLVGGMRLLDFTMNYHGQMIPAGGVGSVAVDLLHKKQGIAKELIEYYLDYYDERGSHMAILYPFRPDFYYRMGFGYGTKMNQYDFSPASLPRRQYEGRLRYLGESDMSELMAFHNSQAAGKNGYCLMSRYAAQALFRAHGPSNTLLAYEKDGRMGGYVAFNFRKAHENNFVRNNLVIRDLEWDSPESLNALCYFLHTQADQIERIVYATQDNDFYRILRDVRSSTYNMIPSVYHESNTSGTGIMYRVTDLRRFLAQTGSRDFNGMDLELTIDVTDTFRPHNAGLHHLRFAEGRAELTESGHGVRVAIDIADLSSLLVGAVSFAELYTLGLASTDRGSVETLDELFRVKREPRCVTAF